ncbi:acyl-CoA dehydrogenase [Sporosarcina sp. P12(2017)]|uniref:acyl-CoA dehydrogenase family protein n=1 Tax=unclassified Sporosarcina TaxID=2647733 RepID=UPI000C16F185|nr:MULTISPECIES: acyl-CoA dehydrogenase family protein [unclassified Sporosarcina]PIC55933.1 acyl-CoA dehydrogenase [Sporosarcina sp. P10]PIC59249.1 acyl-CoA dehydrogenase [Sporosarcina sp. P12(2017)]
MTSQLKNQNKNRFDQVLTEVRARRDEFEKKRHVPKDMIVQLKKMGVYRAHTPQCLGGDGSSPMEFLKLIESISEADGSAGWVASFGSAAVYLAALPGETLAKLYANGPDVAFAGGLFPVQPAERVNGGWIVNGLWKFASGCKGADILGVGIGTGEGGKPLTAVLRPEDVEIIENWEVIGMRGTGSHDLRVKDVFVPDEWTFVRGGTPSIEEPISQYPSIAYAAQVLAVVNLGVARAALNEISLMAGRSGITGAPKMADRAYVRISVAKAEAKLRSARAFFYEATESAWESIQKGEGVSADQTSMLRLAAAQAAREGASAVQSAYLLAGTTAIYDGHPLQRYLRDAMVVTQHAFLNESMYDGAGSVHLGVQPIKGFI